MSLYIGNLSSRISRHELEHVFKRFGRCNVRMKDGYGFVVYDFPPNAEKALRELQNGYICGEPLTLTWSNIQPRADKRFAKANRANQPQHDQDPVREGCMSRKLADLDDQRDSRMNFKQPDISGGMSSSAEMHDEGTIFHPHAAKEVTGEDSHDYREDFLDVDNDRWGEKFSDPPVEHGVEHGIEFDRYEPAQGYDEKHDENHQVTYSSSFTQRKSQMNTGRDHFSKGNSHLSKTVKHRGICYRCGGSGHKMHNCTQKNASRRNLSIFDHRPDGEIDRRGIDEGKLERYRSRSREKLHSSRDTSSTRGIIPDIELSPLKRQRSISSGRSPVAKKTDRPWRKDYNGDKRSKKVIDYGKEHSPKKAKSFSSPLHSDHTVPKLHSTFHYSKHGQRSCSHSRSKSLSPRARSMSPGSKSSPASYYSRSKTSKFMSRSPTSLSLPGSPCQPLPSPSNKVQSLMMEPMTIPIKIPKLEAHESSFSSNSTSISSEELSMVLKHFGLDLQGEKESDLDAEAYFGSARFWPWQIIYYRRLKKGPVTVENYAKRVEQNKEFHIVDKFIRSSSGWGESDQYAS